MNVLTTFPHFNPFFYSFPSILYIDGTNSYTIEKKYYGDGEGKWRRLYFSSVWQGIGK